MQTILGAGGAIGDQLARKLKDFTSEIRLVSRNPSKVNESDHLLVADLTRAEDMFKAVEGSEVVYLVLGLPFDRKIWVKKWPVIMAHAVSACEVHGARLVFLDNMYMYGPDSVPHMTEDAEIAPVSVKGKVRSEIAGYLMEAHEKRKIKALIARSADFMWTKNSLFCEMVIKNLLKGKKAQWPVRLDKVHSFTYVPDAAEGMAILGNSTDTFGEVWHLPTSTARLTMIEWIDLVARELDIDKKMEVVPKWLMRILGWFIKPVAETRELLYQYDRDYFFDSSKFIKRFDFSPTPPHQAIEEVLLRLKNI